MRRFHGSTLAAGLFVLVAACASTAAPSSGSPVWPGRLASAPGTLLRSLPLGIDVPGGRAYRILYVSATSGGRLRTSGGVVVVPDGRSPSAGSPVVAWAHPVVGADVAPSTSTAPLSTMSAWLGPAMENGWVVVATDFAAAGTRRQETLVGRAEANDIAYSVLAVRHVPGVHTGSAWIAFGESAGGHGALWSGSLAPALTPGLRLLGVAAVAPVAELVPVEHAQGKPWATALVAQTPPPLTPSIPAFVAQGTRDDVVPAATTALLQQQWCRAGTTLDVEWLHGVTHDGGVAAAGPAVLSWMEGRFRGAAAPENCSTKAPVVPTGG